MVTEQDVESILTYYHTHSIMFNTKESSEDVGKVDEYFVSITPREKSYKPFLRDVPFWAKAYIKNEQITPPTI